MGDGFGLLEKLKRKSAFGLVIPVEIFKYAPLSVPIPFIKSNLDIHRPSFLMQPVAIETNSYCWRST